MKKLTILLLLCFLTGCTSTYWNDLGNDLTDVVHLRFQKVSFGAAVNVSHIAAGLWMQNAKGNNRAKLGLGGLQTTESNGGIIAAGFPLPEKSARSGWGYGKLIPPYGSVAVDVGFFGGVGVKFDIFEFFDFFLGFAEVDFIEDDENSTTPKQKLKRNYDEGYFYD